ncbi:MAG: extensin family protein [Rhizobiales bacterium]|nr:extensin family protein [Hyphomicrobiales bacterium]
MSRFGTAVLLVLASLLWFGLPAEAATKRYCFFEMESMCPGRQPAKGSKIRKPKKTDAATRTVVPTPKPKVATAVVPVPKAKPAVAKSTASEVATSNEPPKPDASRTPDAPPPMPEPKPETAAAAESPPPEPEPKPGAVEPPQPEPKPDLAQSAEPPAPEPKPDMAATPEPGPPAPGPKPLTAEPVAPTPATPDAGQASAADAAACRADLAGLGVSFTQAAETDFAPCTIENAVQLSSIKADGDEVAFIGKPIFNCNFARRFSQWVADVAIPVVRAQGDKALSGLSTGPGFECRNRNGDTTAKVSEHASGNAVDIDQIVLADKSRIAIAQVANTGDPHYRMLMALRTSACGYFTTVLGPGSNEAHASHYHLDLGVHGKSGNYRICE